MAPSYTENTEFKTTIDLPQKIKICPRCRTRVIANSVFCPNCGWLFEKEKPDEPKQAIIPWGWIALFSVCLNVSVIILRFVSNDSLFGLNPTPTPTLAPTPIPTPTPTSPAISQETINPVNVIDDSTGDLIRIPGDTPSSYAFPDSNTREWTYDDVRGMTAGQVRYCLNELYGRHGYIYKKQVWYDYFIQKTWYKPSIPADSFSDSFLSSTELSNVKLLLKYYEDMDYPDY